MRYARSTRRSIAARAGGCAALLTAFAIAAPTLAGDCEPHWDHASGQPGTNWEVTGLGVVDLGDGPALYASGFFTTAGGDSANRIAKWDGANWSPLGSGLSFIITARTSIVQFDDGGGPALYIGGSFSQAGGITVNRIARWNGSQWSALAGGVNNNINAMAVFDDGGGAALYAGGGFTMAGGSPASRLATWDGAQWSEVGGGTNGLVNALLPAGSALYVGGNFTTAGGVTVNRIAKWDGSAWSALGEGFNGAVWALTMFDDGSGNGAELYAAGDFTQAGGVPANGIAKWDGARWSALGAGLTSSIHDGNIHTLIVFDDGSGPALYAGGEFDTAGGVMANSIARWDGEQWTTLGAGMAGNVNPWVYAMEVFDDGSGTGPALYLGGVFLEVDGTEEVNRITAWRGCPGEPSVFADLNGDGVVNVFDLLILLAEWGECADVNDCPADLDDNGVVDVFDLLLLLANWS